MYLSGVYLFSITLRCPGEFAVSHLQEGVRLSFKYPRTSLRPFSARPRHRSILELSDTDLVETAYFPRVGLADDNS